MIQCWKETTNSSAPKSWDAPVNTNAVQDDTIPYM
jgi:hypothetical protein